MFRDCDREKKRKKKLVSIHFFLVNKIKTDAGFVFVNKKNNRKMCLPFTRPLTFISIRKKKIKEEVSK